MTAAASPVFNANRPQSSYFNPPTTPDITIHIGSEQAGQEISVPVGKPFAIELTWTPSAGLGKWEITQLPSFLALKEELRGDTRSDQYDQGFVGGGLWAVFVIEPKQAGKGNVTLKMPCHYDSSREVTHTFTIHAG